MKILSLGKLLVVIAVFGMCKIALAVTGDTTLPLFGAYSEALNIILPILVPFLVSVFARLKWSEGQKLALLGILCFVATAAIGWFGGFIVKTDLSSVNFIATLVIVYGVADILYKLLKNKIFKPLTANVGNTEKKMG